MTANLLTLNSSKTEFLLTGLKQQLAKISSCSLDTVHSARNLGFIFHEHRQLIFWPDISLAKSVQASRSFKVTDFGTNEKLTCDVLLVINNNLPSILHHFQVMADYWSNFR